MLQPGDLGADLRPLVGGLGEDVVFAGKEEGLRRHAAPDEIVIKLAGLLGSCRRVAISRYDQRWSLDAAETADRRLGPPETEIRPEGLALVEGFGPHGST